MVKKAGIVGVLLMLSSTLAGGESAEEVIKKIFETYQKIKSAQVDYMIMSEIENIGIINKVEGTNWVKGDKVKYKEVVWLPDNKKGEQLRVSDGKIFWVYQKWLNTASRQVFPEEIQRANKKGVKRLGALKGLLPIPSPQEKWRVKKVKEKKKEFWLIEPVNLPPRVVSHKFWVGTKDYLIYRRELKATEQMGIQKLNSRIYAEYKNYKINIPIPEEEFSFQPPEGVKVVSGF